MATPPLLNIVKRADWNALPPKDKLDKLFPPVKFICSMWTESPPCYSAEICRRSVRQIQEDHMARGLPDIAYNFLVGDDGHIYEGRGWLHRPTPNKNYPELDGNSIKVAIIGTSDNATDDLKTNKIRELTDFGKYQGLITEKTGFIPEYDGVTDTL